MRTAAGRDFQSDVMGNGPAAGAGTGTMRPADFIALTANATAPADTDTTLAAEIATAGGGLIRKQATYAHTAGASNYTLTVTFTANGTDVLPVTAAKIGVFNASAAGRMPFTSLLSAVATLNASGDQLTITETVSI
jgi:hypothetical protein